MNKVKLLVSGIGMKSARHWAQEFVLGDKFDAVLNVGFCGALTQDILKGAKFIAKTACFYQGGQARELGLAGLNGLSGTRSRVLTVEEPCWPPTQREQHFKDSGAPIVDMELWALAEVFSKQGMPLASVKLVLDDFATAHNQLKPDLSQLKSLALKSDLGECAAMTANYILETGSIH